ncbi:kinase-like domain-containing protein [Sporodiniella umbellata]|nr:kinase-like domain-containing protein [Sporodiniella umbellata]
MQTQESFAESVREENDTTEPAIIDSNAKLNTRRQVSHGLEINTSLTKTNAFFNTDDLPTPRPPPSISRKISLKKNTPMSTELEENRYGSYTSRFRNLMTSSRQASVAPAPIPQHLKPIEQSPTNTFSEDDKIVALPTPKPSNSSGETNRRKFLVTKEPEQIPVISCLSPTISTKMPKLSDEPILGDYVEQPIKREHIYDYSNATHVNDEDIIGKRIGSYRISKLLGVGAFSKVFVGDNLEEKKFYAIKTIQKGSLLNDPRIRSSIEREIGILKYINHPSIVHLEATMETEQFICIVLEYVEGGELFDFVQKMHHQSRIIKKKVDETSVKNLFLQLVKAVKWLHEHHIVHRDLKLENILIHKQNDQIVLKITDFGLARVVDPESPLLTTRCGSEEYAAPEIVQNKGYDGRMTDVWSLGIILYALLVGYLPFRYDTSKHEKVSQLFYRIVKAEVKWPTDELSEVSPEAKFVVSRILERNPEKRISICDIEALPWLNQ